ncbi:hypothetical protein Tco_0679239 [Tanacetum coccineum]|uniref:Retrotransposon Copia-like N-terminal domain-containing protein n=1 Tax=Tanacetum coccineum TaxID=301880 RepID=A0ABQ4XII9_9ASTR
MAGAAQNTNNTTIRLILLSEKLTSSNFTNWYRNLRIVLRYEKKIKFVEQPTGPAPDLETADPDTIDNLGEEVWIFLPELIFTFPRKLRTPSRALQQNEACHPLGVLPTERLMDRQYNHFHVGNMKTYCGPCSALEEAQAFNHVTEELYPGNPEFTLGELGVQYFLLKQFSISAMSVLFFMFLLSLEEDKLTVSSPECSLGNVFLLELSTGDNLTSDRSLNKLLVLAAGRIGHDPWEWVAVLHCVAPGTNDSKLTCSMVRWLYPVILRDRRQENP